MSELKYAHIGSDISHGPRETRVLKLATGTAFLVGLPLIAGVWLVSTSNQLAGIIIIGAGVVLGIFMLAVMLSSPPGRAGRLGPSPD